MWAEEIFLEFKAAVILLPGSMGQMKRFSALHSMSAKLITSSMNSYIYFIYIIMFKNQPFPWQRDSTVNVEMCMEKYLVDW